MKVNSVGGHRQDLKDGPAEVSPEDPHATRSTESRAAKLLKLEHQLKAGSYRIPSQQIAGKIVQRLTRMPGEPLAGLDKAKLDG